MSEMSKLTSLGDKLNLSPETFGWLKPSTELLGDQERLRDRLDQEGYLYLPGYLDQKLVNQARGVMLEQLDALGVVDSRYSVSKGIAKQPWQAQSFHHLIQENEPLQQLLFHGLMLEFYEQLFAEPVRHFDFTWIRALGPGPGTAPHADSVYMGRGTQKLYTSWTPLMEIPTHIGGLTIMPGSHRIDRLKKYYAGDVDTYCENSPDREPQDVHQWVGPLGDGKLSLHPATLQQKLNLPWLTAETFRPGDVVVFNINTIHGSLDNQSDRIRLSTDTRYQRASEPADERWVGPHPIGHGGAERKGLIC